MNILRTIQKQDRQWWIDLLFKKGPHKADWAPLYPPQIPLPFEQRPPVEGGYLYLVFKSEIIGFGHISEVKNRQGMSIGSHRQHMTPGSTVIIEGPFQRMPPVFHTIRSKGFQGVRYTDKRLHTLSEDDARAEIPHLRLD